MIPPDWASNYIGIPYKPHGRSRHGSDCWYFIHLVLKEQFGVTVPTYDGVSYEQESDRERIADYMNTQRELNWRRIDPCDVKPGDVVLFRMLGVPIHVGVMCAEGLFLHCERGCNSCVERLQSSAWKRRIEGFYRPRNLSPQDVP